MKDIIRYYSTNKKIMIGDLKIIGIHREYLINKINNYGFEILNFYNFSPPAPFIYFQINLDNRSLLFFHFLFFFRLDWKNKKVVLL